MHWQMHKVAARHGKRYYETGKRMPVAVCLGGDPVMPFCAMAPMPDGLDEVLLAGFLRKKSVPLVKCETIDLEVPAHSDFVIEGYIDPTEPLRAEGPFGDHTGFYTPIDNYPVFHVTCITHRRDAIYPATIVGKPPMEDLYLGQASVRLFLPVFKMNFPEIVDMALPAEGVFHNLVFVSIRKQYPYQAYKIMHGLWGMGQMMFTKIIVVVDAQRERARHERRAFSSLREHRPAARQPADQGAVRQPRPRADVAEHRLAHRLRRDAETSRRRLHARLAGGDGACRGRFSRGSRRGFRGSNGRGDPSRP